MTRPPLRLPSAPAHEETDGDMGSVIKKRRKKMRKHKYKKLRARMRHKRKRGK